MARSRWKLTFFSKHMWRNLLKKKRKYTSSKIIYSFERSSVVPRSFNNFSIFIHKGNSFKQIIYKKYFFGKKLGEFSFTKKPFFFPIKKKKR